MNHKAIFLDIDGTLLPFSQDKAHLSRSLKILNAIIAASSANIVFSTAWRRHSESPKALLAELYLFSGDLVCPGDTMLYSLEREHGFTPMADSHDRTTEIAMWLQSHPEVDNYVVLDDIPCNSMALKPRWIRIHQRDCLTWANAEEALRILGVEIPWFN